MQPRSEASVRLRTVVDMLRTGRIGAVLANQAEFSRRVSEEIKALREVLRRDPDQFDAADRQRLDTVEAELHSLNGLHAKAVRILKPLWQQCEPELTAGRLPKGDRRLGRERLLGAMHFVYASLTIDRQADTAVTRLRQLDAWVHHHVRGSKSGPSETRAIWEYLYGVALRMNRDFRRAESRFLRAQEEARRHCAQEIAEAADADARATALAYRDVFCARVLSGVSWCALQQGRLTRARHLLSLAQMMLVDAGHQPLRLLIRSLYWVAVRRAAPYPSAGNPGTEYYDSLKGLEECFTEFEKAGDVSGQSRCASEIVRGALDGVEFGVSAPDGHDATDLAALARRWLVVMRALPTDRRSAARLEQHGLRYRWLLQEEGLASGPRTKAPRRITTFEGKPPLMIVHAHCLNVLDGDAVEVLRARLRVSGRSERPDPLGEAECSLALAMLAVLDNRSDDAMAYLQRWEGLAHFIENAYLDRLANELESRLVPTAFELPFEFPIRPPRDAPEANSAKSLRAYVDDFERWLLAAVRRRGKGRSMTELAWIHGSSRGIVTRRMKDLGLPLEHPPRVGGPIFSGKAPVPAGRRPTGGK
jgi:hypothetical protein